MAILKELDPKEPEFTFLNCKMQSIFKIDYYAHFYFACNFLGRPRNKQENAEAEEKYEEAEEETSEKEVEEKTKKNEKKRVKTDSKKSFI